MKMVPIDLDYHHLSRSINQLGGHHQQVFLNRKSNNLHRQHCRNIWYHIWSHRINLPWLPHHQLIKHPLEVRKLEYNVHFVNNDVEYFDLILGDLICFRSKRFRPIDELQLHRCNLKLFSLLNTRLLQTRQAFNGN